MLLRTSIVNRKKVVKSLKHVGYLGTYIFTYIYTVIKRVAAAGDQHALIGGPCISVHVQRDYPRLPRTVLARLIPNKQAPVA